MSRGESRALTAKVGPLTFLQSRVHLRPRQIRDVRCCANSRVISVVSAVSDQSRMIKGRCEVTGSNSSLRTIYGRQPPSIAAACRDTRDKRDFSTQPAQPDRSTQ
jgi:hypothetical protein